VAAGIALLAGIGVGAWLIVEHSGSQTTAQSQQNPQTGGPITSPGGAGSPAAVGSPAGSSPGAGIPTEGSPDVGSPGPGSVPPSGSTPSPGAVAIAPALADNPAAPTIAAFLDQYFAAINTHDYQAYVALLSPQAQGMTQSQFDTGYGSSTDTGETLKAISAAANGDSVAQVTFTSHQSAAQSATNSTCTIWNVSLYLVPNAGSYLIDNPPSGYHAEYAACG
jgi:hypothetical protein